MHWHSLPIMVVGPAPPTQPGACASWKTLTLSSNSSSQQYYSTGLINYNASDYNNIGTLFRYTDTVSDHRLA